MPLFGCRLRVLAQNIKADFKHMGLLLVSLGPVQYLCYQQSPTYGLCLGLVNLFFSWRWDTFVTPCFAGAKCAGGKGLSWCLLQLWRHVPFTPRNFFANGHLNFTAI